MNPGLQLVIQAGSMDRLPIRNTTGAKPCSSFGGVMLQPLRSNAHHDIQQL